MENQTELLWKNYCCQFMPSLIARVI